MAAQTELGERILDYGTSIIKVGEALPNTLVARRIADQLLRSGLSVGANFEEAQAAESAADFAHKLQIALKEAREAKYWLRVVSEKLPRQRLELLVDESDQLVAMLSKAVAKAKGKAKQRETAPAPVEVVQSGEGGER